MLFHLIAQKMKILFFALFIFSTSLVNAKTLWKEKNGTTIFHANKIYKSGKNIMYTFTIMVHIANVYIIFLPDFINIFLVTLRQCVVMYYL